MNGDARGTILLKTKVGFINSLLGKSNEFCFVGLTWEDHRTIVKVRHYFLQLITQYLLIPILVIYCQIQYPILSYQSYHSLNRFHGLKLEKKVSMPVLLLELHFFCFFPPKHLLAKQGKVE